MPLLARNHRVIQSAKLIDGRRTRYTISGVPGLWLDVWPNGSRTWYVRYQLDHIGGRKFRYYRVGDAQAVSLAEASDKARQIRNAVDLDGIDVFAAERQKPREAITFQYVFDQWYQRHAVPKLARPDQEQGVYRKHLQPLIGQVAVDTLRRSDIAFIRDRVARERGPSISNQVVTLFNRVMNWAVDEDLVVANPAMRLRKIGQNKPRERVLSDESIRLLWRALDDMESSTGEHIARGEPGRILSPETRSILRIMLLTGQRRGEVVGAERTEFDFSSSEATWTIPSHRTKNRLLHRVPLCAMAAREFSAALSRTSPTSPFVFPAPDGSRSIRPESVTRAMSRLVSQLGCETVSPHDMRRTVGTGLARLGVPVAVRALILNHSPQSRGITDAVYNRYAYDAEKRAALSRWEARLVEIISAGAPVKTQLVDVTLRRAPSTHAGS
jgi:integrase